jgi:hypothetical protein
LFNNFGNEPRFSTRLGGVIAEIAGGLRASITINRACVTNERNDDVIALFDRADRLQERYA